jgi:parallel beta-helix repeat protein
MHNHNLLKKALAVGIIVLFIGMSVIPTTGSIVVKRSTIPTFYDGSLSGYVNDTSMNPIERARVRVYFHETYEENYTDSSGYYHVTNIPICNCTKNATASKEGYRTEWVLLSIGKATFYDFVLTPLGNTLYVGGTGSGNYTRIQDAIDNATDGDTVFVYDDSSPYYENVVVDKSINLMGEDKNTTIIDGNEINYTVGLFADGVHISGFTIQNAGNVEWIFWDVTLYVCSNENTISGNIFICDPEPISDMNNIGIGLINSSNNYISQNLIEKYFFKGIELWDSHYNEIIENVITDLTRGLRGSATAIDVEDSSNNIIKRNEISKNNIGIILSENQNITSNNKIIQNNFLRNLRYDACFNENEYLEEDHRNTFDENYWDRPRLLPKPIFGSINLAFIIPFYWVQFDWHPAQEPYDVP